MSAKKTELVVKSNRLVEASYRLSLVEQQVVLYAICRCREEEKGLFADLPVTIRAQDFAKQYGIDGANVYHQLKESMDTLFNRHVVIHDTDPETGKPRVTKTRWISQASYVDGAGHVQFIFAPAVIPYITRLGEEGGFTSYRLEKIGRMTSIHAVRLYELLVQYVTIGKREVGVQWLRDLLQIGRDEYPRIVDFKKRVVDVAVDQINDYSDLNVSYEQRKTGRAVSHFDFKIRAKSTEPKPKAEPKAAKKPRKAPAPANPQIDDAVKGDDARKKAAEALGFLKGRALSHDEQERAELEALGQQCLPV